VFRSSKTSKLNSPIYNKENKQMKENKFQSKKMSTQVQNKPSSRVAFNQRSQGLQCHNLSTQQQDPTPKKQLIFSSPEKNIYKKTGPNSRCKVSVGVSDTDEFSPPRMCSTQEFQSQGLSLAKPSSMNKYNACQNIKMGNLMSK